MRKIFALKNKSNTEVNQEAQGYNNDVALSGIALFKAKIRNFMRSEKVRHELEMKAETAFDTNAFIVERKSTGITIDPDKLTEAAITSRRMSKKELEVMISPEVHDIIKNAMEGYIRGFNKN